MLSLTVIHRPTLTSYTTFINIMDNETMAQDIKEIKSIIGDLRVDIASLPEKIFEKADCRYAAKTIEEEVNTLKRNQESRGFEVIKLLATVVGTIVLTIIFSKYLNIRI